MSKHYFFTKVFGKFLNFTELFAHSIIFQRVPKGATIKKNVPYGESKREVLDLIYPNDLSVKRPLVIYIHGGGWISGKKNMRHTYCYNFVRDGFVVANIDYMDSPAVQYPQQLQQCLSAIDFLLDNAEKYYFDTSKILVAGESAGGYYVCFTAAIAKDKSIVPKLGLNFKHNDTFDVNANIINCGAINMRTLADNKFPGIGMMLKAFTGLTPEQIRSQEYAKKVEEMSPDTYIGSNFPPTYIIYGSKDKLQTESFALYKKLCELGVPNDIFKGEGLLSQHAWAVATVVKPAKECFKKTSEFVYPYIFDKD